MSSALKRRTRGWIVLGCILIGAVGCGKSESPRPAGNARRPTTPPAAVSLNIITPQGDNVGRDVESFISRKWSKPVQPALVLCPFTDSNNRVTTESLGLYFPTFFHTAWTPKRVLDGMCDFYVWNGAWRWGVLKPGATFSDSDARVFAKAQGYARYAVGKVDSRDGRIRVQLTLFDGERKLEDKEVEAAEADIHKLPGQMAMLLLRSVLGGGVTKEMETYVARPAASSAASFRRASTLMARGWRNMSLVSRSEWEDLVGNDHSLDWAMTIYLDAVDREDHQQALGLAQRVMELYPDNPRFREYYASAMMNGEEHAQGVKEALSLLKDDLANVRGFEILARAVYDSVGAKASYPVFQKLIERAPDSAWTNYHLGQYEIALAWEYRGSGWANTVTEEGWRGLHDHLVEAEEYLEKAAALDPRFPHPYEELITVGKGLNRPKEWVIDQFRKGISIDPNNYQLYACLQTYLMPKWHGSMKELRAFWTETRTYKFTNREIYLLPLDVHWEQAWNYAYDSERRMRDDKKYQDYYASPGVWEDIRDSYDYYFKAGPDSKRGRSVFGYYACMCQQYETAFQQYEMSKMGFEDSEYRSYDDHLMNYIRAAGQSGHYTRALELVEVGLKRNKSPRHVAGYANLKNWILSMKNK
ncbi:MAG: DUF4034 domain-containing protein [bacterium]